MALYGSGTSWANGGSWSAPFSGIGASLKPLTILTWVKNATGSGNIGDGIFGGLGSGNASGGLINEIYQSAVYADELDDSGTEAGTATLSTPAGTDWFPIINVYRSATSRSVYLRNGMVATDATNTVGTQTLNYVSLGDWACTGFSGPTNGMILMAEFAIWRAELGATEIRMLQSGFNPSRVRPQSLLCYFPLRNNLHDAGPLNLTLRGSNPNWGEHPFVNSTYALNRFRAQPEFLLRPFSTVVSMSGYGLGKSSGSAKLTAVANMQARSRGAAQGKSSGSFPAKMGGAGKAASGGRSTSSYVAAMTGKGVAASRGSAASPNKALMMVAFGRAASRGSARGNFAVAMTGFGAGKSSGKSQATYVLRMSGAGRSASYGALNNAIIQQLFAKGFGASSGRSAPASLAMMLRASGLAHSRGMSSGQFPAQMAAKGFSGARGRMGQPTLILPMRAYGRGKSSGSANMRTLVTIHMQAHGLAVSYGSARLPLLKPFAPSQKVTRIAFPRIDTPLIDANTGQINAMWYRLILALWNRTGGNDPS